MPDPSYSVRLGWFATDLDPDGHIDAAQVPYDNATSGLTATDAQAAIDEVAGATPVLALDDLTDVTAPSPSGGDALTWDNASSRWVNTSVAAGVTLSDSVPLVEFGTGAAGTAGDASRADHVHPADAGGGTSTRPYPLDRYTIDATYGDDFTGSALDSKWTRRNYTSGAEGYQVGYEQTYLRVTPSGRAAGDGYFQTAPAGDFTIACKLIHRGFAAQAETFGPCIIDTAGTGVAAVLSTAPGAPILNRITTYSTNQGTYVEPGGSGTNQNIGMMANTTLVPAERPVWWKVRKSSTNYFMAYSLDGEAWSAETPALAATFTVDRMGFIHDPKEIFSVNVLSRIDIDWFNVLP